MVRTSFFCSDFKHSVSKTFICSGHLVWTATCILKIFHSISTQLRSGLWLATPNDGFYFFLKLFSRSFNLNLSLLAIPVFSASAGRQLPSYPVGYFGELVNLLFTVRLSLAPWVFSWCAQIYITDNCLCVISSNYIIFIYDCDIDEDQAVF